MEHFTALVMVKITFFSTFNEQKTPVSAISETGVLSHILFNPIFPLFFVGFSIIYPQMASEDASQGTHALLLADPAYHKAEQIKLLRFAGLSGDRTVSHH